MKLQNFLIGFLFSLVLILNSFVSAQTTRKHSTKSHTSSVKKKSHKKKKKKKGIARHHREAVKTNNQAAEVAPEPYTERKGTKSP